MKIKDNVALFDIDDTIYNGGIIFPLMESEVENGLLDKKYVDEVYKYKALYQKGELRYEELSQKVVIAWAEGLKGKSYIEVAQNAEKFILQDQANFYSFTSELLSLLKKNSRFGYDNK